MLQEEILIGRSALEACVFKYRHRKLEASNKMNPYILAL
jgi:hypothetical protein